MGASSSDATKYPQATFNPKEISKKAVRDFTPPTYPFENEHPDFFNARKKAEKNEVDKFYEETLNRFAGLWDDAKAFENDAPNVLTKWDALLFHHEASAGFNKTRMEVAESVYDGRGFQGQGNLGGNPFFDVAIVVAVKNLQGNAYAAFDERYRTDLTKTAHRWANARALDLDRYYESWFDDFKARVISVDLDKIDEKEPNEEQERDRETERKGAFDAYQGHSGLRRYACLLLTQFLARWTMEKFGTTDGSDDGNRNRVKFVSLDKSGDGSDDSSCLADSLPARSIDSPLNDRQVELLRGLARDAYDRALLAMTDLQRRVMKLRLGDSALDGADGARNKEVARRCGLAESQTSAAYARAQTEIKNAFTRCPKNRMSDVYRYLSLTKNIDLVECFDKVDPESGKVIENNDKR